MTEFMRNSDALTWAMESDPLRYDAIVAGFDEMLALAD